MTMTRGSVLMVTFLMAAALGVAGCPKRPGSPVSSAPAPSGAASGSASGQSGVSAGKGSQSSASSQSGAAGQKSAATMQPSEFAPVGSLKDIRFDFDRYEIRAGDAQTLNANAQWLKQNSGVQVLIEGHCDERGTLEYNLALGDRRAKAAAAYLMSQGVNGGRLRVISYGEERPLCSGHDEPCWSTNRRDHFLGGK